MKLERSFAQQLIDTLWDEVNAKILVADQEGQILACSDYRTNRRSDTIAKRAVKEGKKYHYKGSKKSGKLIIPFSYKQQLLGALILEGEVERYRQSHTLIRRLAEKELKEMAILQRLRYDDWAKDKFMVDFLLDPKLEQELIAKQAELLNTDISNREVVLLFRFNKLWGNLESKKKVGSTKDVKIGQVKQGIILALNNFFSGHIDHLVAYLGGSSFADLIDIKKSAFSAHKAIELLVNSQNGLLKNIKDNLTNKVDVTVGLGNPCSDMKGIKTTFSEAKTALQLGLRIWGPNRLYFIRDLGVARILGEVGDEVRHKYIVNIIQPILNQPEMMKTLRIFFESDLNLSRAAERSYIHRNTLIYRLDKITEQIGLDPRIFDHAIQISTALMLYALTK